MNHNNSVSFTMRTACPSLMKRLFKNFCSVKSMSSTALEEASYEHISFAAEEENRSMQNSHFLHTREEVRKMLTSLILLCTKLILFQVRTLDN